MKSGLGLLLLGVLSQYRAFDTKGLVRKPECLNDEEAAILLIAAITAWIAINDIRTLSYLGGKRETILI